MQKTKTGRNEKVSYKCIGWFVVPGGAQRLFGAKEMMQRDIL